MMNLLSATSRLIRLRPHLLALLLLTDLLFFGLHLVHHYTGLLLDERFSIETDRGFAETFQYVQELWCVLLLFLFAYQARRVLFAAWGFLYAYFLLDDILLLHEKMSVPVSHGLHLSALVGAAHALDVGEILFSLAVAAILIPPILIAHWRSRDNDRSLSASLFLCTGALIACGLGVDFLHSLTHGLGKVPAGLLEDGGEMLAMSGALAALFAALESPLLLKQRDHNPQTDTRTVPIPAATTVSALLPGAPTRRTLDPGDTERR